jgi:hypothetical protein
MFTLAFEHAHRVLLVRYVGVFTSDDVVQLDRAVIEFVAQAGPVRGLLDFSSIEAFAVPHTLLAERGRQLAIMPAQERVIVAPNTEIFELARFYASLQRDVGNLEPRVVMSLPDAYLLLGLEHPDFEPLQ